MIHRCRLLLTDTGFSLLGLNKLTVREQTVDLLTSKSELDANVAKYLDTAKYPNVKVLKFTTYPDTSKTGKAVGKILVEEPLTTGRKAQYEYEVTFKIDDSKIVNVTLPTKVLFSSEDSTPESPDNNDHAILKSKEYKIINNTKLPVKVSISSYDTKGNVAGIKNLQLALSGQTLDIVTETKDTSSSLAGTSFRLDSAANDLVPGGPLVLTGETDLSVFDPDKARTLTHVLKLEFQSLDETGN